MIPRTTTKRGTSCQDSRPSRLVPHSRERLFLRRNIAPRYNRNAKLLDGLAVLLLLLTSTERRIA